MTFSVSILATGSELLDGRVLDTNSHFVARELSERGLKLKRVLCVDDDIDELLAGLRQLTEVSQLVITSGGLGPTSDDLTRDLLAAAAGVSLVEFPNARAHLESFYRARGRVVDSTNLRQALLPEGAEMIPNPIGTAPGFIVRVGTSIVCSLSGVPREFQRMFNETVLPLVVSKAGLTETIQRRSFKVFGLPESLVGAKVEDLALSKEVTVSYRAAFPEVHVTLKCSGATRLLDEAAAAVRGVFAPHGFIFTEDPKITLLQSVHALLLANGLTVATAESCTGGMVGQFLTQQPGSSGYFRGGVLAYSDEVKRRELGVPETLISSHGAVSAEVVAVMAEAARSKFKTDYALAVSGVAGPDGGSDAKPVGTVYLGVASSAGVLTRLCFYASERENVRRYSSLAVLDMLRRSILGAALPDGYPVMKF